MKIHFTILRQQLKERAGGFAGVLAIFLLTALACYFFARPKFNVFMVALDVLISVSLMIIAGFIFWLAFMGRVSQLAVFKLYGGYRFLKEAPYTLSRIQGNIAKGLWTEAEAELLPLAQQHPGDAQVARILSETYIGPLNRPEAARTVLERYFLTDSPRQGDENWKNLTMLADLEQNSGKTDFAVALLRSEMRRAGYGKREKEWMAIRLSVLTAESGPIKSGRD